MKLASDKYTYENLDVLCNITEPQTGKLNRCSWPSRIKQHMTERVRITWATLDGVLHCRDIPKSLCFLHLCIYVPVLLLTFVVTFIRNISSNTMYFLNFCRDIFPYRGKCHDKSHK